MHSRTSKLFVIRQSFSQCACSNDLTFFLVTVQSMTRRGSTTTRPVCTTAPTTAWPRGPSRLTDVYDHPTSPTKTKETPTTCSSCTTTWTASSRSEHSKSSTRGGQGGKHTSRCCPERLSRSHKVRSRPDLETDVVWNFRVVTSHLPRTAVRLLMRSTTKRASIPVRLQKLPIAIQKSLK